HKSLHDLYHDVFDFDPGDVAALEKALDTVSHIVIGSFETPFLMGDPNDTDPQEARSHVNFQTGKGDVRRDTEHSSRAATKAKGAAKQAFPVAHWGHGVTGNDTETLIYAGDLAKQGIATLGITMPEHGLVVGTGDKALLQAKTREVCLVPWADAIGIGRA